MILPSSLSPITSSPVSKTQNAEQVSCLISILPHAHRFVQAIGYFIRLFPILGWITRYSPFIPITTSPCG